MAEPVSFGSVDAQRKAEMEAGRARVMEVIERSNMTPQERKALFKRSDEEIKADEERRRTMMETPVLLDKVALDRAGAEVADQAQTALEAALHTADRRDKIIFGEHQLAVERLEHPDVNVGEVKQITLDTIVAQAVNQPTPLANERGLPTEGRPLNNTAFADEELELNIPGITPSDRLTPKTVEQAERSAEVKTPEPEEVVRPGWHEPERVAQEPPPVPERAPLGSHTLSADVTPDPWRAPPVEPEDAVVAVEEVVSWPEDLQPPELRDRDIKTPVLDKVKRERARPRKNA